MFIRFGVDATTVTYLSLLTALGAFLSLTSMHDYILYGILVFSTGLLDGVDGAVARMRNEATPAGALTDSVVDRVSELIILMALAIRFYDVMILGLDSGLWMAVCVSSWQLTSYVRCRAESLGVKDLDIGLGGRSERVFALFLMAVFNLLHYGLPLLTALGVTTASYRFVKYRHELRSGSGNTPLNHQA
ncbi:MAG: CDP-alcohol phosphatidyltransferase family protein [Candidatus Thorarchaeota archaeon]